MPYTKKELEEIVSEALKQLGQVTNVTDLVKVILDEALKLPYIKKELENIANETLKRLGETTDLTDFNVGSVARNLIESISTEIYFLYAQLDQVYDTGFIDTASGKGLDEVVKILGVERDGSQSIKRKESNPASGMVVFGRNTKPTEKVTIPKGTRVTTTLTPVIEFKTTEDKNLKTTSDMLSNLNNEILDWYENQLDTKGKELLGLKDELKTEEDSYADYSKQIGVEQNEISTKMNAISRQNFEWLQKGINIGLVLGKREPLTPDEVEARDTWTKENINLVNLNDQLTSLTRKLSDTAAAIDKTKGAINEKSQAIDDLTLKRDAVKGKSEDLKEMLLELLDIDEKERSDIVNNVFKEAGTEVLGLLSEGRNEVGKTTVDRLKNIGVWPWEVSVPVRAVNPGSAGNKKAGEIGTIPIPISGIDYVRNNEKTLYGRDPETDEDLRKRAKKALQIAARATEEAIYYALLGIDGVNSVTIVDMPNGIPGEVKVIVKGSGYDENKVINKVEKMKSVGVKVEVELDGKPIIYVPQLGTSG